MTGRPLAGRALAKTQSLLRSGGAALLDLFFPPSCLVCRAAVAAHGALCPLCWRSMRFIERPFCERLGSPFDRDHGAGVISPEAAANPPAFGRARAVARYDCDKARALVNRLKYYDRCELAGPMGLWMARAGADVLAAADLLVPVPLHRARLVARRYNQAAALARKISQETAIPLEAMALRRVKQTAPQVGLPRGERARNLAGAFRVEPDRAALIEGRNIVLVDDVLTTGATANAATRALLKARAARVDLLVFARTPAGA